LADLNFSYGFRVYPGSRGQTIQRPVIPALLTSPTGRLGTDLLVDSGADFSMIPREFAELALGIDLAKCRVEEAVSASGTMRIAWVTLNVTIRDQAKTHTFEAPFQVPLDAPGYPHLPLLGREPAFRIFDVSFRLGYTQEIGKLVFRLVTKTRNPSKYRVGGRGLADLQSDAREGRPRLTTFTDEDVKLG
jgi:hypothetical protein